MARASEALVLDHDTAGFLAGVLTSCQEVLTSDTSGILSAPTGQPLQLLAASSHTSAELELHQSQIDDGPCVDARNDNAAVSVSGDDEIRARWPLWGQAMTDAGVAMDEAYLSLVRLAASEGRTLTDIAHEVIAQAAGRTAEG